WRIGKDDVITLLWKAQFIFALGIEGCGQDVTQQNPHIRKATKRQIHARQPNHFGIYVVSEKGLVLKRGNMSGRELVSQSTPLHFSVNLDFLNGSRRRIRKPDMVIGRHQKASSAGGRIVNGLPYFRVNDCDNGADNMPG